VNQLDRCRSGSVRIYSQTSIKMLLSSAGPSGVSLTVTSQRSRGWSQLRHRFYLRPLLDSPSARGVRRLSYPRPPREARGITRSNHLVSPLVCNEPNVSGA
jgi:hypothetical protein